jgi:hypothetical protein
VPQTAIENPFLTPSPPPLYSLEFKSFGVHYLASIIQHQILKQLEHQDSDAYQLGECTGLSTYNLLLSFR